MVNTLGDEDPGTDTASSISENNNNLTSSASSTLVDSIVYKRPGTKSYTSIIDDSNQYTPFSPPFDKLHNSPILQNTEEKVLTAAALGDSELTYKPDVFPTSKVVCTSYFYDTYPSIINIRPQ